MTTNTISASFTALGLGGALGVRKGESLTYSVTGTFVGTVVIEQSLDGGQSWHRVPGIAAITDVASGTIAEAEGRYRFRCSAFTSGTIVTAIADAVEALAHWDDRDGNAIAQVTGSGFDGAIGQDTARAGSFSNVEVKGTLKWSGIESGLTAHAGGTHAGALALDATKTVHRVATVGTAADSVKLPASAAGMVHIVINDAASNSLQVFGFGTDTIDAVATDTGVALAAGKRAIFFCYAAGTWVMIKGA